MQKGLVRYVVGLWLLANVIFIGTCLSGETTLGVRWFFASMDAIVLMCACFDESLYIKT